MIFCHHDDGCIKSRTYSQPVFLVGLLFFFFNLMLNFITSNLILLSVKSLSSDDSSYYTCHFDLFADI